MSKSEGKLMNMKSFAKGYNIYKLIDIFYLFIFRGNYRNCFLLFNYGKTHES